MLYLKYIKSLESQAAHEQKMGVIQEYKAIRIISFS